MMQKTDGIVGIEYFRLLSKSAKSVQLLWLLGIATAGMSGPICRFSDAIECLLMIRPTATVTFGKGKKYSTIQLMHYTRFSETTRLSISILFFALVRYRNGVRIFKSLPLPNLTDVAEVGQSYFFIF